MKINKEEKQKLGKFLAADSIYIAISWVARNEDPMNVTVVMLRCNPWNGSYLKSYQL